MKGTSLRSRAVSLVAAALALLVGACNLPPPTPMWGLGSPRNGADQPVDSVYGASIPGYPLIRP